MRERQDAELGSRVGRHLRPDGTAREGAAFVLTLPLAD